ncbi:MAG: LacI family transcriptional regulator [Erysipelotrichaceae bacterium]|nr:LacI family transcriptional regulator [Erysipelotrichaceae bacterium]
MSNKKNISMREIAKLCNVSIATVSRVMNNESNVSNETRKKVLQVMEEYNYQIKDNYYHIENPKNSIGVILASSQSDYYTHVQRHVTLYFLNKGIDVIHYNVEDNPNIESKALNALYRAKVDGLVMISCHSDAINDITNYTIPTVWIDSNDKNLMKSNSLWVTSDHYVSGQMAASEFILKGCKNPLIITGPYKSIRQSQRNQGFIDSFKEIGIEISKDHIVTVPSINDPFTETKDLVKYLYIKGLRFDCIFVVNDWRALGAMIGLQQLNIRVPEQVKIIGYDGISLASKSIFNITSIRQNTELIARSACELLWNKINDEEITENHIIIPTDLVQGQTT